MILELRELVKYLRYRCYVRRAWRNQNAAMSFDDWEIRVHEMRARMGGGV